MRVATATLIAVSLVAAGGAMGAIGSGGRVWVDDDGTAGRSGCEGAHPVPTTIQEAVDAAAAGTTIHVCPGRYDGTVRITRSGLQLVGAEPWQAVLRADRTAAPDAEAAILVDGADHVSVSWLRIHLPTGTGTPACAMPAGIRITGGARDVSVRANRIRAVGGATLGACAYGDGVAVDGRSRALVAWNVIRDFAGAGIGVRGRGTSVRVHRNAIRFWHRRADPVDPCHYGAGIVVTGRAGGSLTSNRIGSHDGAAAGRSPLLCAAIHLRRGTGAIVAEGNVARNAYHGLNLERTWRAEIRGNRFAAVGEAGIIVLGARGGTVAGNVLSGTARYGILVPPLWPAAMAAWPGPRPAGLLVPARNMRFAHNTIGAGHATGCLDRTVGALSAGTQNHWTGNRAASPSRPAGICPTPAPGH